LIVADTNLVAYLLIEGERTQAVRAVWRKDSNWVLPPLWRAEFLSVLVTTVRAGVLDEEEAHRVWERAISLFGGRERHAGGRAVLSMALEYGISAYDAQFAVVAVGLGVTLVSGDRKLCRACDGIAVSIEDFPAH